MTNLRRGLFLILVLAVSVAAQETRGRVQGSVRDPSGALVAGANVALTNGDTGLTAVKATSETGHYLFDMVVPGHYSITVAAAGFKAFVQKNILVEVGGDMTVDAAISVLVIVGLLFGRFLGWIWMDPVAALCGAVVIAAWAYGLATPVPSSSI